MGWLRCHLSTAYALPRTRKTNHRVTSCSSHLERASDPCAQCSAVVCGANRGEWLLSALRMCHLASYVTLALPGDCTRRRGYSPLWVALGASAVLCPGTCSSKAVQSLFPQEMAQTIRACRPESSTPPASNLVCEANFGPSFGGPTRLLFLTVTAALRSFRHCTSAVDCSACEVFHVYLTQVHTSKLHEHVFRLDRCATGNI